MNLINVKRTLFFCALLVVASCRQFIGEKGNGIIITEQFAVGDFKRLDVEGSFDIQLEKSTSPGIVVTTDENLMDFIRVDTEGNTVTVSTERNLMSKEGVNVVVRYTELESIYVGGAAILRGDEVIRGEYLEISMSGAGSVELEVELNQLEIDVSGAGAVQLAGRVTEQNIEMNGAGGLDAEGLISEKCEINISGVGGASIHVTDQLIADVSGVGGITYRGDPSDVQKNVSGIGTISQKD